jgi:hypothetical protein
MDATGRGVADLTLFRNGPHPIALDEHGTTLEYRWPCGCTARGTSDEVMEVNCCTQHGDL